MANRPTEEDRIEAIQRLLSGLEKGSDAHELAAAVGDLHPRTDTFPGEVFMELAADALDIAGISRDTSISYEGLREAHLPECGFRGRENRKIQYAILTSAALRAGLKPDLLDEVIWWQNDDYWRYALFATVGLIRAAADLQGIPVAQLARQIAEHHGVTDAS
ncbi:MAG: hypothetical protein QNJ81_14100 [Acidimicrobiia bacterium]|nr:hypothetical protein [Acidimicrobiia bacterium]